jgi:serine/threonine protein kinase
MVVNQRGAGVDNQQMVVIDQRVGGGAGGGVAGQPHHQVEQGRAGQAVQGVENHQGRSIENSAEFGDVAQYRELNAIGTGAYGTVYRAEDLKRNEIVAMKKVRIALTEDGVPMSVLREISLLRHLGKYSHPNIVRLVDICHGERKPGDREMVLYLVFEHMDQDLAVYLERCPGPGLAPDRIKDLMWQLLCGIDFLHSHRIVHRDIKPQNVLLGRDSCLKLADFGLARIYDFNALLTSTVVTLWYRAPEVLLGTTYATPVDIWSAGCILAELFTRKPLFPGQYEVDQLGKIFEVIGTPVETDWPEESSVLRSNFSYARGRGVAGILAEFDPQATDLLSKMLTFQPSLRITAAEALAHPYFADFGVSPHDLSSSSSANTTRSQISDMSDSSLNLSQSSSSAEASNSSSAMDKSL